jgi:hypothetical protein
MKHEDEYVQEQLDYCVAYDFLEEMVIEGIKSYRLKVCAENAALIRELDQVVDRSLASRADSWA